MKIDGLFDLQVMMFLLMAVGVVLRKMNIITKEGKGMLTDLVIDLILPCNIISAFYMPMDHSVFVSGVEILIISILIQIFCASCTYIFCIGISHHLIYGAQSPQYSLMAHKLSFERRPGVPFKLLICPKLINTVFNFEIYLHVLI